ncbi:hypothetical protein GA0070216_104348 [Micromonospora matsumotoense]|uniref:Uncharacterized protein n=1 Tax=Micromonospora matsumotoense TaxID=121616 RepID=A0A1C4XFA7_9ACTN|nr:hypothetical protein GA0070216_104348 [Micromonospora matsumotoense]
MVASTWAFQSIPSSSSAKAMTWAFNRAHVPSAAHRENRPWAVFQDPYRSGRSRHGDPVRFTQQIPLMTCR